MKYYFCSILPVYGKTVYSLKINDLGEYSIWELDCGVSDVMVLDLGILPSIQAVGRYAQFLLKQKKMDVETMKTEIEKSIVSVKTDYNIK